MYACMHVCMHVCMYACMYVCVYLYIYICSCAHTGMHLHVIPLYLPTCLPASQPAYLQPSIHPLFLASNLLQGRAKSPLGLPRMGEHADGQAPSRLGFSLFFLFLGGCPGLKVKVQGSLLCVTISGWAVYNMSRVSGRGS